MNINPFHPSGDRGCQYIRSAVIEGCDAGIYFVQLTGSLIQLIFDGILIQGGNHIPLLHHITVFHFDIVNHERIIRRENLAVRSLDHAVAFRYGPDTSAGNLLRLQLFYTSGAAIL